MLTPTIKVKGAFEHNLKGLNLEIERGQMTVVTGVSGSGKSSLAFDTILAEAQRRFFYTLSNYSRQFLDLGSRPAVESVSGLSPAIALAQNETMPSRRSTVGSLSDVSELLGVSFARFSEKVCPEHGQPTNSASVDEIASRILADFDGLTIVICVPLATEKKGNFATKLRKFASSGFARAYIDGEVRELTPVPDLVKEEKHTIKVFIDAVKVAERNRNRLIRSIAKTMELGGGFGEYFQAASAKTLNFAKGGGFSERGGCGLCGHTWPALDSRFFSPNSLGKCKSCNGYGAVDHFEDDEYSYEFEYEDVGQLGTLDQESLRCPQCRGSGLDPRLSAITIAGRSALDCQQMSVSELRREVEAWRQLSSLAGNPAFLRVAEQIGGNLRRIEDLGLGYLQIMRRIRSLSGGESQRLKLAGILGESLRGVLYVLDEPSQGLHPVEIDRLCQMLAKIRDKGNTVLIVDHDETLMRHADWIVDLGPGGGARGGHLLAKFEPKKAAAFAKQSLTAKHLAKTYDNRPVGGALGALPKGRITVHQPRLHNLQMDRAEFVSGALNIVSGVSGAGKSSLVLAVLYENVDSVLQGKKSGQGEVAFRFCKKVTGLSDLKNVRLITRKPIAKSSVSLPATYLDVFTGLRDLYGRLPESQVAGLTAASFSLAREGGRCESCKGRGEVSLQMRFLADARVRCHVCNGQRYRPHLLEIKYNGLNLSEVLELTIDEAVSHFKTFKIIQRRLAPALKLGLGYLKLGQPSSSLSGGESQRLKLVPFLAKQHSAGDLIILDEPTTGLHFEDVQKLLVSLRELVEAGSTVVLIEHNIDVAAAADWILDIGPGSAADGGQLLYAGPPAGLANMKTPTGRFLGDVGAR